MANFVALQNGLHGALPNWPLLEAIATITVPDNDAMARPGTLDMTKQAESLVREPSPSRKVTNGYKKGQNVRQQIVETALLAFGAAGFHGATTRSIAASAGVNIPAIKYYFGSKEGLYVACAEAIIQRFGGATAPGNVNQSLAPAEMSPEQARVYLKSVTRALARLLIDSESQKGVAQFVLREVNDPGAAFDMLYERLWLPGTTDVAIAISRILEEQQLSEESRVRALLMLSSLAAFRSGIRVSLRLLGWKSIGTAEISAIIAALDSQIDAIGS